MAGARQTHFYHGDAGSVAVVSSPLSAQGGRALRLSGKSPRRLGRSLAPEWLSGLGRQSAGTGAFGRSGLLLHRPTTGMASSSDGLAVGRLLDLRRPDAALAAYHASQAGDAPGAAAAIRRAA